MSRARDLASNVTALLIFPCCAVLWLVVCDWLGWVQDEPMCDEVP